MEQQSRTETERLLSSGSGKLHGKDQSIEDVWMMKRRCMKECICCLEHTRGPLGGEIYPKSALSPCRPSRKIKHHPISNRSKKGNLKEQMKDREKHRVKRAKEALHPTMPFDIIHPTLLFQAQI
jgi:hypothetical protein